MGRQWSVICNELIELKENYAKKTKPTCHFWNFKCMQMTFYDISVNTLYVQEKCAMMMMFMDEKDLQMPFVYPELISHCIHVKWI